MAASTQRTLVMNLINKAWMYDIYTPGGQSGIVMHYGEEGAGVHDLLVAGSDGSIFQYTGFNDNGIDINCSVETPSLDQGSPRDNKLYGDVMVDLDTFALPVTVTPAFNNFSTIIASVVISTATGRNQVPVPFDLGTPASEWKTARNIAIRLAFAVNNAARPLLYIWEPRWTFESAPLSSFSWEISPTTFGMENFKHAGIVKITHVSPSDLQLIFTIDNVIQPTITIPNSGGTNYVQNIFRVPVMKAKIWKVRLGSSAEFRLDTRDSFFEIKDWGQDAAYSKLRIFGDFSLVEG